MPVRHMRDSINNPLPEQVYCFDFDGVLCDSMDECLLTSYNAYFQKEAKHLSEIDPAIRKFFYAHRYLIRPAMEYYPLFYAFEKGETVIGKDRFSQLKAGLANEMKDLAERFYVCRKRLKKDMDYWLGLHRVYPECIDFLAQRNQRFFIVTNKDKDSVIALARHHGYLNRIVEIYSREIALNKKILLEKLIADYGLDPSTHRIFYVDDHAGTLGAVRELPLELYMAAWGYTIEPESSSFRVIATLDELP